MAKSKMTRGQFLGTTAGLTFLTSTGFKSGLMGTIMKESRNDYYMTDDMKRNYEVALSILKPTKAQLEHGLELHRNSLVWEPYGFIPRAIDGAAIAEAVNDNASALELQNMREDMMMTLYADNERERKEFENAWKASGVTCVGQNAGEENNRIDILLKRLARFTYATDKIGDFLIKAAFPDDVVRAKKENKHAVYLTGNGVPMPMNFVSVEEELAYIKIFFQLGIRMMHVTYNRRNLIGDGCAETANGGLSDFGRAVIKEMNKVGVIPDVSHSGWQTSLETIQLSEKPAVVSHSVAASLNKVIRSKPDEVIKALADKDSYIGICVVPRFLGGTGDIAEMMRHIDYVVKKVGPRHVAIATDVAYWSQYANKEWEKIKELSKRPASSSRSAWEQLWADEPFKTQPEMSQSTAWTNFPLFTVGMVKMGYSDDDIQKILGENVLRVAKATLDLS
jgi:membrane dipeptidase